MSARFPTAVLVSAVLLLAVNLTRAAADDETSGQETKARLVQHVYSVADLVTLPDEATGQAACGLTQVVSQLRCELLAVAGIAPRKNSAGSCAPGSPAEDRLMHLIATTIQPETWSENGGPGKMEYFPPTMTLVINQSPDVQEQIGDLLIALRRQLDVQVALEVRLISLSEPYFERLGVDSGPVPHRYGETEAASKQGASVDENPLGTALISGKVMFLNDSQVLKVLDAAQADRQTNLIQAPRLTAFNGRTSTFNLTDRQWFVTGVDMVRKDGRLVACPRNEPLTTGLHLSVRPVVSADRRFVNLDLKVTNAELEAGPVPLFPVTTSEPDGKASPSTQFIQQPKLNTVTLERTLAIPDGGTVLLNGWQTAGKVHTEVGPPILSKVPYINRLFKTAVIDREAESVLLMVTPRIIINEEEETRKPARPCSSKENVAAASRESAEEQEEPGSRSERVADLLEKYERACAEARDLAGRALALDPACFSKDRQKGKKEE